MAPLQRGWLDPTNRGSALPVLMRRAGGIAEESRLVRALPQSKINSWKETYKTTTMPSFNSASSPLLANFPAAFNSWQTAMPLLYKPFHENLIFSFSIYLGHALSHSDEWTPRLGLHSPQQGAGNYWDPLLRA